MADLQRNIEALQVRSHGRSVAQQTPLPEFEAPAKNSTKNAANPADVSTLEKWQLDAIRSVASLGQLPHNWDGYASRPPTEEVRSWAIKNLVLQTDLGILEPPQFAPESDGALQVDWRSGDNREIELHVESGLPIEFLKVEGGNPGEQGTFAAEDEDTLKALLTWLRGG